MSVPDHELEPPEVCNEHGCEFPCPECRADNEDLYADMHHQDSVEGK